MVRLSLSLLIASILLSSCGGNHYMNQFYHQEKFGKDRINFTLPGWLIWSTSGIVYSSTKDPEIKSAMLLAKKIKRFRILVAEGEKEIPEQKVKNLMTNMRKQNDFEELLYVKDESSRITIMMREKREKIKNLFILVQDEGETVMLDLRTKLKVSEIGKLVKEINKEFQSKDQSESEKEKPKIRIPQA